jgi:uncharacterized protein
MITQRVSPLPIVLTGQVTERQDDCACPDRAFVLNFDFKQENDNDCACAEHLTSTWSKRDQGQVFASVKDTYTSPIAENFWLVQSPYAPAGPSVLNQPAWERWQEFQSPRSLSETVDFTLAEQNLILPIGAVPKPESSAPETLTAWLHVTNACNLDCPYCYVRKSSASMSLETGLKAVENIFAQAQKHGFQAVKLKYAGGESTLQFRLVRSIHARAQELAHVMGINLQAVVLSNGTRLRPADADWLVKNNVNLMISLDGVGAQHDLMRPMRGGGSSFDALADIVDKILLPRGIRPFASITITRWNINGVANAVRWALERDLPVSLNFYRQNQLAHADMAIEEDAIIRGMLAAYAVFEKFLPSRPFLNGLLDRVQMDAHLHTCGAGISYVVVTHEGKLAQCQMQLEQSVAPSSTENWLRVLGNGVIQNVSVDEKTECSECIYRYRCSGGCPLETFRSTGRWDTRNPNCRIYKTLLPAAMRLEGLRLLKYREYSL